MGHVSQRAVFKSLILLVAVWLCIGAGNQLLQAGNAAAGAKGKATTLENLLTAYQRENNSYALYRAFSQKAESEGYTGISQLFRAAMASVNVQRENHAEAIKKMKGIPESIVKTPEVRTTRENLLRAFQDASSKYNDLYPAFLQQAREERERTALRTFNFSRSAAETHSKFFSEASAKLETWDKEERNFWVCTVCGHMVTALNFEVCPICFNPLDKYTRVK